MVQEARVRRLNDQAVRGDGRYVLYWMQQSQRARFNHALEYAAGRANSLGRPLVVGFGLMDDYPEANERHYAFMLQGLRDVAADLQARGVPFLMRLGQPPDVAIELARRASLVVCDGGYLRHQKRWRDHVADHAGVPVVEVESDVIVPADVASDKQEFAARTIRPKIRRHWDEYLVPLKTVRLKHQASRPGPLTDRPDHGTAIDPERCRRHPETAQDRSERSPFHPIHRRLAGRHTGTEALHPLEADRLRRRTERARRRA